MQVVDVLPPSFDDQKVGLIADQNGELASLSSIISEDHIDQLVSKKEEEIKRNEIDGL